MGISRAFASLPRQYCRPQPSAKMLDNRERTAQDRFVCDVLRSVAKAI